eukprot:533328_1
MANRQQQKKRKKKKKCKPNKVRNNHKTIKPVNVRRKKSEKQQTVIHNQRRPQEEEEKANENGLIEWRVTGNQLHQFRNAKPKQCFYSPPFKTIDGTVWRIIVVPNTLIREVSTGTLTCRINIQCVKLNVTKQRIGVGISISLSGDADKMMEQRHFGHTFQNGDEIVKGESFPTKHLKYILQSLSIKCFIEETMDVSEHNTYFEWKITNYWLKKWKNAKYELSVFTS